MSAILRPAVFAPLLAAAGLVLSIGFAGFRLPGNDEGALLTLAAKLARGAVFYRDLDAYPFPGSHYLLAAAMRAFGETVGVARGLAGGIFTAIVLALYASAVRLLGASRAALFGLALLSFKLYAWPSFTGYFYWDVSFLFACLALALLVTGRGRQAAWRWLLAGACVAGAVASKQNLGIYLAAALSGLLLLPGVLLGEHPTARERIARLAAFVLGGLAVLGPMIAYFASCGLLGRLVRSGLARPLAYYAPTSGISFTLPLRWWEFGSFERIGDFSYVSEPVWTVLSSELLPGTAAYPVYWAVVEFASRGCYTVAVAAVGITAGLWLRARMRGFGERDPALFTTAAATLAVLLSAFPRADFAHLIAVYPMLLLLIFELLGRVRSPDGARVHRAVRLGETAATLAALGIAVVLAIALHASLTYHFKLPHRADLFVAPKNSYVESIVRYVRDKTRPGDPFFVYGHEAQYYFFTDRYSDWPFVQLYPGQAGSDQGRALMEMLEADPPHFVFRGFIGMVGIEPLSTYVPRLEEYLDANYALDLYVFRRYPAPSGIEPFGAALLVREPRESD